MDSVAVASSCLATPHNPEAPKTAAPGPRSSSRSASLRTLPLSNGASESGADGSVQPASLPHTSASSVVNVEGALMGVAVPSYVSGPGASTRAYVFEHDEAELASASEPRVDEDNDSLHTPCDASQAADDEDAPPPLTLCTMKASSTSPKNQLATCRGTALYSSPIGGVQGMPLTLSPLSANAPLSPLRSSSSPRGHATTRTPKSSNERFGGGQGKRRRRSEGREYEESAAHRRGLAVYAPHYKKLKTKKSRRPTRNGNQGIAPDSEPPSPLQQQQQQHNHSGPRPPTQTPSSRRPGGNQGRALTQDRTLRHRTSTKLTTRGSAKTDDDLAVPQPTHACQATPAGRQDLNERPDATKESALATSGASPHDISTRTTEGLTIHAVPLSVSGRGTTTTTTSGSCHNMATQHSVNSSTSAGCTDTHTGGVDVGGSGGSFTSPITVNSHVCRPQLSAVFCRELSTSLGNGGDGSVSLSTASAVTQRSRVSVSSNNALPPAPRSSSPPLQPPSSQLSGNHRPVRPGPASTASSCVVKGRRLSGLSTTGEDSQPPSWSSPLRTRLSPCPPPSTLHVEGVRAAPLEDLRYRSSRSPQEREGPTASFTTSFESYYDEAGAPASVSTRSTGGKAFESFLSAKLPSVLIAATGSGGVALAEEVMPGGSPTSRGVSEASAVTGGTDCISPSRTSDGAAAGGGGGGAMSPRPGAAPPSEFVRHVQQRSQKRRGRQNSNSISASSSYSPAPPLGSPAPPLLPSLNRSSCTQSVLHGSPVTQLPHNYSLSPSSPAQLISPMPAQGLPLPATGTSSAATPAPLPMRLAAAGQGGLLPMDELNSGTPLGAGTGSSPAAPSGVARSVSPPAALTAGCFSMASGGFSSHRGSRTGSGLGCAAPALVSAAPLLTVARVAAYADGHVHGGSSSSTMHDNSCGSMPTYPFTGTAAAVGGAHGTSGGGGVSASDGVSRSQRPPLPTSSVNARVTTTKLPAAAHTVLGAVSGTHTQLSRQGSDVGSAFGSSTCAGGRAAPDAYRTLCFTNDGALTPTHRATSSPSSPPSSRFFSEGPRSPEASTTSRAGAVSMTSGGPKDLEPQLPTKAPSRPAGAHYRQNQHAELAGYLSQPQS